MIKKRHKFNNLKEMLKISSKKYGQRPVFYINGNDIDNSDILTYKEFYDEIESLGTALIEMGLKDKKIAIISENRYEWEVSYLAICTGTGIVVPLDKSLKSIEIENLIKRSEVEAIFYSKKYDEIMNKIQENRNTKLKFFISMDLEKNEFNKFSYKSIIERGKELLNQGNRKFLDSKINEEETSIMLFTSGTTSEAKAVLLSQKNICTNIKDIAISFEINETDRFLSFLPLHHTFECTVGFLYPISCGSSIVFSKGIRHIAKELKDYKITAMIGVPALVERMYDKLIKTIKEKGKYEKLQKGIELSNTLQKIGINIKKKIFNEIHQNLGGKLKLLVVGGAALDPEKEKGFWDLGINVLQGYGLTETSPVISAELTKQKKLSSIGKKMPSVEVKIDCPDENGIGELLVKGDSVMQGYYKNEEANKEAFSSDGWFRTGDLARIDKEGYIFLSGRKKFVIVLKNGKNIYPEEIETLINKSDLIKESMVFGMPDKDGDVTISAKIIYDEDYIESEYGKIDEEEIKEKIWKYIKEINRTMPTYKYVKKIIISNEELIKTTTLKIKRNIEIEKIIKKV